LGQSPSSARLDQNAAQFRHAQGYSTESTPLLELDVVGAAARCWDLLAYLDRYRQLKLSNISEEVAKDVLGGLEKMGHL
jgi:hypothetical protein